MKTKTILRWIFFIPLSFLGTALFMIIMNIMDPFSHTPIGLIWRPIMQSIVFFFISSYIIPSDSEKKIKISLIVLFLFNSLVVLLFILSAIISDNLDLITKYIWQLIGVLISFGYICYYLFFNSGQEKIREYFNE